MLWGMLLEDHLELMLRGKLGAKTHNTVIGFYCSISHPCLEQYIFQHREQRQGLAMAASSFMQMIYFMQKMPFFFSQQNTVMTQTISNCKALKG